jgi:heme A synthase
MAGALVALFGIQIGLGFLNLLLLAPIWLQLVHLLVADLVWISLVLLAAGALAEEPEGVAAAADTPALAP